MSEPDFDQARRYALYRLKHELPPAMCYHSLAHTRDDVVPASERLARLEHVGDEERVLLLTAAYFHDLGLVERRDEHEAAGVAIAGRVLPGFGYSAGQIEKIGAMIMATRLPQAPSCHLGAILADSDLDILGRADFLERNRLLRTELAAFAPPVGDAEWYRQQLVFMREHSYWTTAARRLRDEGKMQNAALLAALLAAQPSYSSL
jgi:uncharacterized protein